MALTKVTYSMIEDAPVNVQDFGAVGDGVTDDTSAFNAAVAALDSGGILFVPQGKYRLTDEIALPGGISVVGENSSDNVYGSPPNFDSVQTYIWQDTPGKAIFLIGGGISDIHISQIAFAASQTVSAYPTTTPVTDGRYGIKCYGSFPEFTWYVTVEDCVFYDLERGISVVDPYAGTNPPPHTYDWNCCPMTINRCRFLYPQIGIYFDTNNSDVITVSQCGFSVPFQGKGVYLKRSGFQYYVNCFGGGAIIENNTMFYIEGDGPQSLDNITLDNCQAETLANFILVAPTNASTYAFTLQCRMCIAELGADIELNGKVHFASYNNRWTIGIYVNDTDVKVSSIGDYFGAGNQFWFVGTSSINDCLITMLPGPDTAPVYQYVQYIGGYAFLRDVAPPAGGDWSVGDITWNLATTSGQPIGWTCIAAGSPGTWVPFGQTWGFQGATSPVGSITPTFVGQEYLDTVTKKWYKSTGTALNTEWVALN